MPERSRRSPSRRNRANAAQGDGPQEDPAQQRNLIHEQEHQPPENVAPLPAVGGGAPQQVGQQQDAQQQGAQQQQQQGGDPIVAGIPIAQLDFRQDIVTAVHQASDVLANVLRSLHDAPEFREFREAFARGVAMQVMIMQRVLAIAERRGQSTVVLLCLWCSTVSAVTFIVARVAFSVSLALLKVTMRRWSLVRAAGVATLVVVPLLIASALGVPHQFHMGLGCGVLLGAGLAATM